MSTCRFTECKKDSSCFQNAFTTLMEIYAEQVLGLDYNKAGSKEVVEAGKVFLKEMAALEWKRRVHS